MGLSSVATSWRRMRSPLARREALEALVCLSPWIVGFAVFVVGPLLYSLYLSMTRYKILQPPTFIGLRNFQKMFTEDEFFWHSLKITAVYTVGAVPVVVAGGYSIALLLNQKVKGLSFWRTAYYLPSVIPSMAAAYLFMYIFNSELGLANSALRLIGIQGPRWFASRQWVLPTFMIMALWGAGGGLPLYLSALQGVPTALYDAALVDGANAWQRFRHVTLPMTSPVILFTFLTGMIGSFQVFTTGYVITDGGPANASLFYVLYLYRNGWHYMKMGFAAAMAWVLFVIIFTLTLVTLRVSGRLVYDAGEAR